VDSGIADETRLAPDDLYDWWAERERQGRPVTGELLKAFREELKRCGLPLPG